MEREKDSDVLLKSSTERAEPALGGRRRSDHTLGNRTAGTSQGRGMAGRGGSLRASKQDLVRGCGSEEAAFFAI